MCTCDVRVKNSLLFREINSKCLVGVGGVTGMAAAQRMWVCGSVGVCVHWRCSNSKWPFFFFCLVTYNVLQSGVLSERGGGSLCVQNGDLKIVWPEFRTMCYLLQIYPDMIGPVVIITWEHLVLFSLNRCNGKQEPFQRTVGAILLLDSISVSLWLLDNSIFGKAGGKMCDVNSP